jgi:hypothetical protein
MPDNPAYVPNNLARVNSSVGCGDLRADHDRGAVITEVLQSSGRREAARRIAVQ